MLTDIDKLQALALAAAAEVAQKLRVGGDRTVNLLSASDVKLQADVDSERTARAALAPSGLPVIGEEMGGEAALFEGDGLYWVVDPLDGTYNYLREQPATCVSIGLMRGSEPVGGVVHDFCTGRVYAGVVGRGVFLNGAAVSPRWAAVPEEGCLMTGFPALAEKSVEALERLARHARVFKKVRMIGSAALAVAYVGMGMADVYYEDGTNLWDVAAGLALVKAAGGVFDLRASGKRPLNFNLRVAGRREWLDAL
ncbi:MAG: inositol monophosphatase [Puniceicoccales bacterium]|jgi:myo-inositol-1(or 4)-monophosphatase|nr:inositol monophosphatase [Puniceicoccales bacterium]